MKTYSNHSGCLSRSAKVSREMYGMVVEKHPDHRLRKAVFVHSLQKGGEVRHWRESFPFSAVCICDPGRRLPPFPEGGQSWGVAADCIDARFFVHLTVMNRILVPPIEGERIFCSFCRWVSWQITSILQTGHLWNEGKTREETTFRLFVDKVCLIDPNQKRFYQAFFEIVEKTMTVFL